MRMLPYEQWAAGITPNGTPGRIPLPAPDLWLHHGAAGTSSITTARSYARYHIENRGWLSIGYSFLIAEGKVLEGRGPGRQGAHTAGENDTSHGICMVGDYTSHPPSDEDLDALRWLIGHGAEQGWWPTPRLTGGHRDAPGASTSCPGDALYALVPQINRPPTKEDAMTPKQEAKLDAVLAKLEQLDDDAAQRWEWALNDSLRPLRRGVRALLASFGVKVEGGP